MKVNNPKLVMDFKDDNTFWVQITTRDDKGQIEKTGKIRIQVDVYPKAMAEANKVGEARQEPNVNPFLPPPVGRLSFSLNPLKMFVSISSFLTFSVTTCGTCTQEKDLLLLLSSSMLRTLYHVSPDDPQ
jgi:hypothetical protein